MKTPLTTAREAAESVAIQALAFLASDPEELGRFLALTGIDHASIREAAVQPGFLAGVLDHVAGDERLLLAFATHADLPPSDVARARTALAGERWQRETP